MERPLPDLVIERQGFQLSLFADGTLEVHMPDRWKRVQLDEELAFYVRWLASARASDASFLSIVESLPSLD